MWPGRGFVNQQPSVERGKAVMGGPEACQQVSALKPSYRFTSKPHPHVMCYLEISCMHQGFSLTKAPSSQTNSNLQRKIKRSHIPVTALASSFSSPWWLAEATRPVTHFRLTGPQFSPKDFLSKDLHVGDPQEREWIGNRNSCFVFT